ncbi:DUF6680 family protein [Brachybacterium paraconglomeratum]|uniref:DUF6680 family protein n=1 Tax=Brachybacterium paraconglomeratum TaxID=173362 RepID=UPI00026C68FE|nr:DUF6680 family protein [Brachybacterium paraconglomeratum]
METIIGALIASASGAGTWAVGAWWTRKQSVNAERKALARELIRSRGNNAQFAQAMNEIPVVFDDDQTLMAIYRQFATGHSSNEAMLELLVRLVEVTGIAKSAKPDDLKHYLLAKE